MVKNMKKITYILFGILITPYAIADYKIYGVPSKSIDIPKETGPQPVLGTNGFQLDENGVTISCDEASPGDTGVVNGVTYTAVDNTTVGNYGYVNECTTLVTSVSAKFRYAYDFNQDISSWDTSNITNMGYMFRYANSFNQDISNWDTGNVKYMNYMFDGASSFNQDLLIGTCLV